LVFVVVLRDFIGKSPWLVVG